MTSLDFSLRVCSDSCFEVPTWGLRSRQLLTLAGTLPTWAGPDLGWISYSFWFREGNSSPPRLPRCWPFSSWERQRLGDRGLGRGLTRLLLRLGLVSDLRKPVPVTGNGWTSLVGDRTRCSTPRHSTRGQASWLVVDRRKSWEGELLDTVDLPSGSGKDGRQRMLGNGWGTDRGPWPTTIGRPIPTGPWQGWGNFKGGLWFRWHGVGPAW